MRFASCGIKVRRWDLITMATVWSLAPGPGLFRGVSMDNVAYDLLENCWNRWLLLQLNSLLCRVVVRKLGFGSFGLVGHPYPLKIITRVLAFRLS